MKRSNRAPVAVLLAASFCFACGNDEAEVDASDALRALTGTPVFETTSNVLALRPEPAAERRFLDSAPLASDNKILAKGRLGAVFASEAVSRRAESQRLPHASHAKRWGCLDATDARPGCQTSG